VGAVEDGHALLGLAEELRPDVILLDISMPLLNGIEACRQLVRSMPKVRVIFLTMHADVVYVEEALRAGGVGYLLKRSAASELITAIKAVMRGERYVTPLIDWKESTTSIRRKEARTKASDRLSPRQREVLQLVAEGQQRNRRPLARIGKDSRFSQVLPQARIDAQFHSGVDSVCHQTSDHRNLGRIACRSHSNIWL